MRFLLYIAAALACLGALPAPAGATDAIESKELAEPQEKPPAEYTIAVLQGLNKVTGHISKFSVPVGTVTRFGSLEIAVHRCWKAPPEDLPENAALLEISELRPGEAPQRIFLGWMFSSSPGLSGLEHPVYDITVLSCDMQEEKGDEDKEKK